MGGNYVLLYRTPKSHTILFTTIYRVFGKLKVVGYILNDNVNRTNFDERKGVCITAWVGNSELRKWSTSFIQIVEAHCIV